MRIVGGRFRGQRIAAPEGKATRPTTDRVRENLFNILENRLRFDGSRVIDLFAGSGALGIEALSRGASFCLFVEEAAKPRAAIRRNIEALALAGVTKVFRRDAARLGDCGTMLPFDLAFADPPYGRGLGERAAAGLLAGGWLTGNAIFIMEEEKAVMPGELAGFDTLDIRSYGNTAIGLFEVAGPASI